MLQSDDQRANRHTGAKKRVEHAAVSPRDKLTQTLQNNPHLYGILQLIAIGTKV
ncbi:MAG TPA: hypothetical protein VGG84_17730 [Gemmatimonadaceae bacterium]|jgi:hypothetical protein